jgi:hypothetical protein
MLIFQFLLVSFPYLFWGFISWLFCFDFWTYFWLMILSAYFCWFLKVCAFFEPSQSCFFWAYLYWAFSLKERGRGKPQASKIQSPSLNSKGTLDLSWFFFLELLRLVETFLRHLISPWVCLDLFLIRIFLIKVESQKGTIELKEQHLL